MPTELGGRYTCTECGQQIVCLRPGAGTVTCCSKPVKKDDPRPLPSTD
jgi:hypothetical protein